MDLLQITGFILLIVSFLAILLLDNLGDSNRKRIQAENLKELRACAKSEYAGIKSNYEKKFRTPFHTSLEEYLSAKGLN